MKLKSDVKFEEKLTCGLKNDIRNLAIFSPEHLKVSKVGLCWDPFVQNRKSVTFKFTEELCVMTMKINAKLEGELTCRFKIEMKNFTSFDPSTQKYKNVVFSRAPLTKVYNV